MTSTDLSVVILTRDAGERFLACLESVAWAREIVAIDAGSRDGTRDRLERFGAVVLEQDLELVRRHRGNFDVARNRGFERASCGWILTLDADEVVPPELRDEIRGTIASASDTAFFIPRRNYFWGKPSRILGEDRQLRLYPKGFARYAGNRLDAHPEVTCPTACLEEPLDHFQDDLLRKLRERTDQRARLEAHEDGSAADSAILIFFRHVRWYIGHQQSWRDGPRGLLLASLFAAYPALTALKVRRLRRERASRTAPNEPPHTGVR